MKSRGFIWRSVGAAVATLAIISGTTPALSARMNFDGAWSVLVVTDYGMCERAYRYGVEIQNGHVFYRGDSSVSISGQVNPRGQVIVQVRQGGQQANGIGRLSRGSGGGTWSA